MSVDEFNPNFLIIRLRRGLQHRSEVREVKMNNTAVHSLIAALLVDYLLTCTFCFSLQDPTGTLNSKLQTKGSHLIFPNSHCHVVLGLKIEGDTSQKSSIHYGSKNKDVVSSGTGVEQWC